MSTAIASDAPGPGAEQSVELGIGILGYAFMGRAHTNAYKKIAYMIDPPPAIPRLVGMCGRDAAAVARQAARFGYAAHYTDWRALLADDRVQIFDNSGPNHLHAEPCIAAAHAGKHVVCEKPLARSAAEAREMLDAVTAAGVKHMVAFNYRFVPAVRLMWDLIQKGALGRIYHYRAVYLQEWGMGHLGAPKSWRFDKQTAGNGAMGDIGSHIIDLGRFLVGEIKTVSALTRTFVPVRQGLGDENRELAVDVDDAFCATVEFESGAIGTLEASQVAAGHKNNLMIEVNGDKGSLRFNLERLNELEAFWVDEQPRETQGFHDVIVTEATHPWIAHWWPTGHIIGWEHTFVHELAHFLDGVVNDKGIAPQGATFVDGYRAAAVCDALVESTRTRRLVDVAY